MVAEAVEDDTAAAAFDAPSLKRMYVYKVGNRN